MLTKNCKDSELFLFLLFVDHIRLFGSSDKKGEKCQTFILYQN